MSFFRLREWRSANETPLKNVRGRNPSKKIDRHDGGDLGRLKKSSIQALRGTNQKTTHKEDREGGKERVGSF